MSAIWTLFIWGRFCPSASTLWQRKNPFQTLFFNGFLWRISGRPVENRYEFDKNAIQHLRHGRIVVRALSGDEKRKAVEMENHGH
jgi:hypothetical protein